MRTHDEDRLVHQLRQAKTLQGAPATHMQLIYAMHASFSAILQQQHVDYALYNDHSSAKYVGKSSRCGSKQVRTMCLRACC